MQNSKALRTFLLGGLLPVIAFSVIEEVYGIMWGLVAGMVFGVGEILYEWRTQGKVDAMTWGGNGMLLVLGGVSLITQEGLWFKLQPSILEGVMALALWVSVWMGKPLLVAVSQKQMAITNPQFAASGLPPGMTRALGGMTWRLGVFFAVHAGLAAWAALHWSTAAWAALKGIGFTVSLVLYGLAESLVLRYRIASNPK